MKNWKYGAMGALTAVALTVGTSGSTLAAWSDTGTLNSAGKVTAGFLKLEVKPVTGTTGWVDLTPDTPGGAEKTITTGKPIGDIASYRMVPGAVIAYAGKVKIGLDGDHLNAKLEGTIPTDGGATGNLLTTNGGATSDDKGVTVTSDLYKWSKDVATSMVSANKVTGKLESEVCSKQADPMNGGASHNQATCSVGVLDKASYDSGVDASHLAVVKLVFDKDATKKQNESVDLKGISLSLKQQAPAKA